jgi:transposase-like protein
MQQLDFAARPNYSQQFREVQRLFARDLNVPMQAMIRELLQQAMHDTVATQVQAGWHERRPDHRRGFRNGTYARDLVTAVGKIRLSVPRTREFASPIAAVLTRYQRRMDQVDAMIRQTFLRGVSTRETGAVLEALCGTRVSAATVSRLTQSLEETARVFHQRPLLDHYRYLFLDGVYLRIREGVQVKRRVVLCAYAITWTGEREFIDFQLARTESQHAWEGFLNRLFQRGLLGQGLELVTTDGNPGLHQALDLVYPQVARQRCWFHKIQNVLDKLPRRILSQCRRGLRAIYAAADRAAAVRAFRRWRDRWQPVAPKAVRCLERDLEELLTVFACPPEHRQKLRTTNIIERCFREVRRRVRPMTLFSTPASCDRIVLSIVSRLNLNWVGHPLPGFTQGA